ncbi:MAG: transglycosylase domain-containing protein [Clostridia bacterium]|nr:transglycosylase domain-containing protein [Clostridia bacterium]
MKYRIKRLKRFFRQLPGAIKQWFVTLPQRTKQWVRELPARLKAWAISLVKPTPQQKAKRQRRAKRIGGAVLAVFLIGVITVSIVGCMLVVYIYNTFDADAYIPILGEMSMDNRSVIYVKNDSGKFVPYHNLLGGTSVWTDIDKIPVHMQNAVVAIEDERFWDHEGVDIKRTAGAMVNLVMNRVFNLGSQEYGGSTITQQLIKVTTQNKDHSIKRKVNEIMAASAMEANEYTKEEILEGYLNNVPLTGDLVGVGIGARAYFGKELKDLTLAECAVLASITNNPSIYDPYKHPENVRQRQLLVLGKMYECEFITKDEYVNAVNQELVFKSSNVRQQIQDYYVDLVVEDVIADLMEDYGYTYTYANNMVYYGGLNIYSAEDPKLQAKVEAIFADEDNFPEHRDGDKEEPQTCFFAMDYDGRVMVTIGGRGKKEENRVLNRSTQSVRSPGSSMKPITSYGPAILENRVHYSSMLRDAPITLPNGDKWPHNYEMKSTPDNGDVLLGVALQKSLNTTAARLVQQLGTERSYNHAQNTFHLTTLVESKESGGQLFTDNALSPLALGALTDGVTAREMTAAYAIFGNGGYYCEPYTYYEVTRGQGEDETVLLTGGAKSSMSIDPQSAYVMVSLLRRVVEKGTAWNGIGENWKGWQVYGKTGTSESEKDVYFSGATPYYCASSWFGYDNNDELSKFQTGYAKSLWSKAMKVLHENKQIKKFEKPDEGIETLKYCLTTGQLATDKCKKTEKGVYKTDCKPGLCEEHAGKPINKGDKDDEDTTDTTASVTETTTTGTTGTTSSQSTETTTSSTESTTSSTETTTSATDALVPEQPENGENPVSE